MNKDEVQRWLLMWAVHSAFFLIVAMLVVFSVQFFMWELWDSDVWFYFLRCAPILGAAYTVFDEIK